MRRVLAAGIVNLVLTVAPASPAIRARHECLIAFDGVAAGAGSQRVFCRDGDPHCDVDGAVDGHCTFDVRLCVNVRGVAGCRLTTSPAYRSQRGLTAATKSAPPPP